MDVATIILIIKAAKELGAIETMRRIFRHIFGGKKKKKEGKK